MYYLITNSEINKLGISNTLFTAFSHARMNIYSTGDKKVLRKTDNLTQWFGLLHNDKQIYKRLVFRYSPITFA